MSRFPSLPLFTDAFIADTQHLDARETGAYLMLLMMAWRSPECRLPDDDKLLARCARMDGRGWRHCKPKVMQFWDLEEGFYTQKRLRKEYEYVRKSAAVSRESMYANRRTNRAAKSLKNNETGVRAPDTTFAQHLVPNPNPNQIEEKPPSNRGFSLSGKSAPSGNGAEMTPKDEERRRLKVEAAKSRLGYDSRH